MFGYIFKRIIQMVVVLLVISTIVFYLVHLIPGDPVVTMLGMHANKEAIEATRERLGLDQPLGTQYYLFIKNAIQGDFGISINSREPVIKEIKNRYPYSFRLALGGTFIAAFFGIIFGIISATNHNKFSDNILMIVSLITVSTPSFFLAILMILIFALYLGWFPSTGLSSPLHYVLPVFALGTRSVGIIARMTRSAMLEVLGQDYIRTANSKGLPNRVVVYQHALKNAIIPIITIVGLRFGGLLAGSALIEMVFGIPGIGRLLVDSVLSRDYPVIQATVLLIAATFVIINTVVDIMYVFFDPRIKY